MIRKLKHWLIWRKVKKLYKEPWTGLFRLEVVNGKPTGRIDELVEMKNGDLVWRYYWTYQNQNVTTKDILEIRYNKIKSKRFATLRAKKVEARKRATTYWNFP